MRPAILENIACSDLDRADQQHQVRLQAMGSEEIKACVLPQRTEVLDDSATHAFASRRPNWPWPPRNRGRGN